LRDSPPRIRFVLHDEVEDLAHLRAARASPQDITLQEVRIECFFPANRETDERARAFARGA
jgi:hypothetical protein